MMHMARLTPCRTVAVQWMRYHRTLRFSYFNLASGYQCWVQFGRHTGFGEERA